jgi:hypothetical protein
MLTLPTRDVMLVCRNGHVITDRLRARPDLRHIRCDVCGVDTFERCPTCDRELPGAPVLDGPGPVGAWPAPDACPGCGAAFPWSAAGPPCDDPLTELDRLLRRVPRIVRGLRPRFGKVADDRDLSDLLRAVLPVSFDYVFPMARTPRYAAATRMDFRLGPTRIAVVGHRITRDVGEAELRDRWTEDARDLEVTDVETLMVFAYDPEGRLPDPRRVESVGSWDEGGLRVRCVVAGG